MKKIFTLLTLLLCAVTSSWADDVTLFTADFTDEKYNVTYPTTKSGTVTVDEGGTTVTFKGCKSNAVTWSSTDGITFTNNNISASSGDITSDNPTYYVSIPLTGVNGSIIVTTTGSATKWYYSYTNNAAQTTIVDRQQAAANHGFTISGLTNSNVTLFIGSSGKTIKTITIKTPAAAKTATSEALKSSAAVKVDDTALTKDATTNGYRVDGTTITLSNDITATSAPTNVKLVKTITYDDSSTADADVTVTFDGTVTSGYFIGTASIGLTGSVTNYTVKVKQDVTPSLTLSAASADVTLKSYEVVKANGTNLDPVKVTLTGGNLTDGEYNVSAEGLTISPASFTVASGSVSQEFSINTTATTAASTEVNFTVGELTRTFTLNLTRPAKRSVSQSVVTAATTWDWANASDVEILLTKTGTDDYTFNTDPVRGDEFLMATLPEVNNNANFNSQALVLNTQYVKRTGNYLQGNSVKFKTNLSGTYAVTVLFANTSNRSDSQANRRYLYIDGTNTNVYTLTQSYETATANLTLDGSEKEIVINAFTGEATPKETMVRISKIIFTPTVSTTISSYEWATFSDATHALDFSSVSGLTAYMVTGHTGSAIEKAEVTGTVPAGTGLLLNGAAGTYNIPVVASSTTDVTENKLKAGDGSAISQEGSKTKYVLGVEGGKAQFQKIVSTPATVPVGKAYLEFNEVIESRTFGFDDEVTAIKNIKVGTEDNVYYDLQGRRVLYPKKGLYIVNGKKVIVK